MQANYSLPEVDTIDNIDLMTKSEFLSRLRENNSNVSMAQITSQNTDNLTMIQELY